MPKLFPLLTAIFTAALLSSSTASAALVSCATSSNPTMCSLCDVFVTGNTIVNYFSGILLPIALVTLTFGGILYLMNRVDQAKSIITASVLGIILSLSAFLIVNITLRALDVVQPTGWNTFTCTAQVAATPPKTDGTTFNTTGDGGPKDTVGNPGDITGDPTVTPTTPICNENRDTSNIPMTLPLSLTLNCTNPDQIVSAIWRFPSDSNFGSQNVNNKDGITFTSIDNPSSWNDVTVVVTDTKGRGQTYTYGFGAATGPVAGTGGKGCTDDRSVPIDAEINVSNAGTRWLTNPSVLNVNKFRYERIGEVHAIKLIVPSDVNPKIGGILQMDSGGGASAWDGVVSRCRGSFDAGGREQVMHLPDYYGPGRGGPGNSLVWWPHWIIYPSVPVYPRDTAVLYPAGTVTPDGWVSDGIYYINTRPIYTTATDGVTFQQARGWSGLVSDN